MREKFIKILMKGFVNIYNVERNFINWQEKDKTPEKKWEKGIHKQIEEK